MKKNLKLTVLFFALLAIATGSAASSASAFGEIMQPYEKIRLSLMNDSVEGVGERAEAIRKVAESSASDASIGEEVRPLLAQISGLAKELATAQDIEASRQAFYEVSKILVQYRSKLPGDDVPSVMYCPMARRSWLQLTDEVGNPYYGQSMASCGNVVGEK